jgi:hypothetical protein
MELDRLFCATHLRNNYYYGYNDDGRGTFGRFWLPDYVPAAFEVPLGGLPLHTALVWYVLHRIDLDFVV